MNEPQPVFTKASILESESQWLQEFCRVNQVRNVLEFGPGASTLTFLNAGCTVVSIEENWRWFQTAQQTLMRHDCTLLLGAPPAIMEHPLLVGRRFDLAFVDGPAAKGELPRLHSMQAAMLVAPVVMLHDANRRGEKATIAEVMKVGGWSLEITPTKRGIAVLRKTP